MKKAGIIILIIAIVTFGVYTGVVLGTSSDVDVKLYDGGSKPNARAVEIIYNSLMFKTGSYRYSLQVAANVDKLTADMSDEDKAEYISELKSRLEKIKTTFEDAGREVSYDESKGFVNIVLASYANADERAIANGETGYDKPSAGNGTKYNGYFFYDYAVKQKTVFARQDEPTVIDKIYDVLTGGGFISDDDIDFVFNYGTAYSSKLIRTDADYVYKFVEGGSGLTSYVHEFRMSRNTCEREITIVQHAPNSVSWYIIIIVCILIVVGVTLIVLGVKKGDKRQ